MKAKATVTLTIWYDNAEDSEVIRSTLLKTISNSISIGLLSDGDEVVEDVSSNVEVTLYY